MNFLKSILLSIISGLLLGLAWPTYGITAFIFIAFIPLLHVAKYNNKFSIKIFLCFYLTFLIWNIIATSWLYYASLGGVLFAVLVNSLLMTIVFSIFFIVSKKINSKLSLIFLVSFWLCFEKFHLMWDFSWPWLNIGNVFSEKTEWIQWYEYTGSFGGTLWVLLTNILIYKVFLSTIYNEKPRLLIVSVILVIIVPITISKIILYNLDLEEEPIDVFIIQPNIDPYSEKYIRTDKDNYHYVHDLLEENSIKNSTIILPETFFSDGTQINGYSGNEFIKQLEFLKNKFNSEILTGIEIFEIDEHPKPETSMETLTGLRTAFKKDGVVTAGNASGINDGASALVLANEEKAKKGKPLARIVSYGFGGVDPDEMGMGPVPASKMALNKAQLTVSDLDLIESNEAFAAQACAVNKQLGLNPEIVNVNGGAIALGHPVGATGAIIMTKLVYELRKRKGKYGLATMCIGGGQGIAVIIEAL